MYELPSQKQAAPELPRDTQPPQIRLLGDMRTTVRWYDRYNDAGVFATDAESQQAPVVTVDGLASFRNALNSTELPASKAQVGSTLYGLWYIHYQVCGFCLGDQLLPMCSMSGVPRLMKADFQLQANRAEKPALLLHAEGCVCMTPWLCCR